MRRLPPLLALVGTLLLATPTLAQNVAPDGARVPDDCRDADLTVVCGLIPPWGNGMFEYFGGGPDYPATRRFTPFPADERPWRLCLEGAFGPEWSLRPCGEMIAKDADALADFAGICVMREEWETCALGELSEFDLPVHFVWNEEGIEVISEGSAVEFEYSYAVPEDCADPYTICGLLHHGEIRSTSSGLSPSIAETGSRSIGRGSRSHATDTCGDSAPLRDSARRSGRSSRAGRSPMEREARRVSASSVPRR